MDTEASSSLHLPSLKITGFRGFDHLTIPRLGRVTLLAGRNAVGKTTVLDAVRVFAARGLPSVFADLLEEREELAASVVEDRSQATAPDVAALFHGRGEVRTTRITIGPVGEDGLALEASQPEDWTEEERELLGRSPLGVNVAALRVEYGRWSKVVPGSFLREQAFLASRSSSRELQAAQPDRLADAGPVRVSWPRRARESGSLGRNRVDR